MNPAEVASKYVGSDRCGYGFLFLIKLLQLKMLLILLTNILTNELINPSDTKGPISNYNYQMTYDCVGNNSHIHQLNWLENKVCRQLVDSNLPVKNDLDKYNRDTYNNYANYSNGSDNSQQSRGTFQFREISYF